MSGPSHAARETVARGILAKDRSDQGKHLEELPRHGYSASSGKLKRYSLREGLPPGDAFRFRPGKSEPAAHVAMSGSPLAGYLMASKPAARSAMMSSMFSVPMDRRTVVGLMPAASSSSSVSWECVVEAG